MIAQAPRASAILYSLLAAQPDRRPFLLPANICPIVPLTFLKGGFPFAFGDIDPITLNLDLDYAARQIKTGRFGGLLYAHSYGDDSTPIDFFAEIKHRYESLLVIDDRCLCIPDLEPDPGNPADILLYSTGYAKMVDLEVGGYAFIGPEIPYQAHSLPFQTTDLETVEKAYKKSIADGQFFSYLDSNWLQTDGFSDSWDVYRQKIGLELATTISHRREINAVYAAQLPKEFQLPERYQTWRFNLRVENKETILKAIFEAGLFASSHYASLAGIFAPGSCPQAETLAAQAVNLFNDHHYSVQMAEKTCQVIRNVL